MVGGATVFSAWPPFGVVAENGEDGCDPLSQDRTALQTTFRDDRRSRPIALLALPDAYSCRIRTTVSVTAITHPNRLEENPDHRA